MTSLFAAAGWRVGEELIISSEDYPAYIALATIGLAAVRSTPEIPCSHIQDSNAS